MTLLPVMGMRFHWPEVFAPLAVVGVLGPCAVYYKNRQVDQFVMPLTAITQMLIFTSCFTVLMYALAAFHYPLIDAFLVKSDAFFGVYVPDIHAWSLSHPWFNRLFETIYNSTFPQSVLVILVLGFSNERIPLEKFVLQFMICLCITVAIFLLFPALGPFHAYGYEASPSQTRYLEHLQLLRNGEFSIVSLKHAEGLVTFPSFHTTWAVLLTMAVWHRKKLFIPIALLNVGVIAATMTTGWHYFTDVLAGILLATFVITLTRCYPACINEKDANRDRQKP